MKKIIIPETEIFDEDKEEFYTVKECSLQLEHSLKAVRNWESVYKKPFFSQEPKTDKETLDYIKCMTINKVDPIAYSCLTRNNLEEINNYIQDKMTATTFSKLNKPPSREIVTAEIIYYWMVQAQIPFECEKWHINQLFTLLEVCSRKNSEPKKMNHKDLAARNRALNAQRKAKMKSRG